MNNFWLALVYFILFLAVIGVFCARVVLSRYKIKLSSRNSAVNVFKGVCTIVAIVALSAIIYF